MGQRKLFCDINPTCYAISLKKENCRRHIKDFLSDDKFAHSFCDTELQNVVSGHTSNVIKRGPGIEPELQKNKAVNIELACKQINGIVIHPGEVFSFWRLVGKTTERKGYKNGRVLIGNRITPGLGGGLCNLGHTIHRLVLDSPLEVTEFHSHSDALAPDQGERVPFSTGTSICYNHVDFRFRNNTDQDVQIVAYCKDEVLHAELRSEHEFPCRYLIVEEDLHFKKEGEKYYRNSKIYRETIDKATGITTNRELILDNHSEVMFDYSLIPADKIR